MSSNGSGEIVSRDNRALRSLRAVKEYAEHVAKDALGSSFNELTKKAVEASYKAGLPREEQNATLEAMLAIVDVATAIKEACNAAAQTASAEAEAATKEYGNAAEEETFFQKRGICVVLLCLAAFVAALYFRVESVAVVAFVCCVVVVLPELRAILFTLIRKSG